MNLEDFLLLSRELRRLGDAVVEQLEAVVLRGESLDEQNGNALRLLVPVLRQLAESEVEDADEWIDEIAEHVDQ